MQKGTKKGDTKAKGLLCIIIIKYRYSKTYRLKGSETRRRTVRYRARLGMGSGRAKVK